VSEPLHPVWGHEGLRAALAGAVRRGTLPATLLFHGPRGAGKQRLGLWLAQLLLCEAPLPDGPCGSCRPCRLAVRVEHPDLHWYFPLPRPSGSLSPGRLADALEEARAEALSAFRARPLRSTHSDELRAIYMAAAQSLRRRAHRRPSEGSTQVFLIAEADTLVPQEASPEAANVLLKLLEEPPAGTRFVLTSSEPGQLLPTIRSRSLPIHVPALPAPEVERFLHQVGGLDPAAAARAARLSEGSIGRALGFIPEADGEPGPLERLREEGLEILEASVASGAGEAFRRALEQRPFGARGLTDLLDALERCLRDLSAVQAGAGDKVSDPERLDRLRRLAARLPADPISPLHTRETLEQARLDARGNVNPQLILAGLVCGIRRALLQDAAPAAR
jgi:DNA polymerase-3 subunit delta'